MKKKKCCNDSLVTPIVVKYGPMGPTGPTGPTGAVGPATESIVVRSTNTINAGEQARVVGEHNGNTMCLDFYIPKGDTGDYETIKIGTTTQVDSTTPAEVSTRREGDVCYLDFKIPQGRQGLQGERGEKGETGAKGDTGDAGAKGDKGETGAIGPQGPQGPKGDKGDTGEKGEQGAKGDTGPVGTMPNINATIFCDEEQSIVSGFPVKLNAVITEHNVTVADNKIKISANGIYIISYSLNKFTSLGNETDHMVLSINGIPDVHTRRPISNAFVSSGTVVMTLVAGDTIGISTDISQGQTVSNKGGPSAILTLAKLAEQN